MKKLILPAITILFLQGCTVVGMVLDDKFPQTPQDENEPSSSEMGFKADIDIAKSLITGEPLPGNEPKQQAGCDSLKDKDKAECFAVAKQLSDSLNKHIKK